MTSNFLLKISVKKTEFLDALTKTQFAVETKSAQPILQNVKIESLPSQKLRLTAFDGTLLIQTEIPAIIEKEGATTLPLKRILNLTKELQQESLTIQTDSKNISSIESGTCFFKIHGISAVEFPEGNEPESTHQFEVENLKSAIKLTQYASAADESAHAHISGLLFSFEPEKLTLVGTDRKRLAIASLPGKFDTVKANLPSRCIQAINKLAGDEKTIVDIKRTCIKFKVGETTILSKLIAADFPNYEILLPKTEAPIEIVLSRTQFLSAISRVSVLSEKTQFVKLTAEDTTLTIETSDPLMGEASETITLDAPSNIKIAFHPEYLMAPLKTLNTEKVHVKLTDNTSACIIESPDRTFRYILMPMHL
jgi:DNA polymerase-3 subunit beta